MRSILSTVALRHSSTTTLRMRHVRLADVQMGGSLVPPCESPGNGEFISAQLPKSSILNVQYQGRSEEITEALDLIHNGSHCYLEHTIKVVIVVSVAYSPIPAP